MSTGYAITKVDLDNTMGRLVAALRDNLKACVTFKALLDDTTVLPDATLTALGYSGGEITTIRAAFADLKKLSDIANAAAVQAATNDFWFSAKHLTGIS
jgi:hypothetical protein